MGRYSVKEKVTPQVFDTVDFDSLVGGAEGFNLHPSSLTEQLIFYFSCTISEHLL
jgi:hypothetical protein